MFGEKGNGVLSLLQVAETVVEILRETPTAAGGSHETQRHCPRQVHYTSPRSLGDLICLEL